MSKSKKFKMFEKYNSKINIDSPQSDGCNCKEGGLATNSTKLIYDIKGRPLGVEARVGGKLSLYFNFESTTELDLADLFENGAFGFELLDKKHRTILSAPVSLLPDTNQARVDLVTERSGLLDNNNYYIYLYVLYMGIYYTLFDEQDGVLSLR